VPASGGRVTVTLAHGEFVQQQTLSLDAFGHGRGVFTSADLGTNLVTATIDDNGERAEDATQLEVTAQAADDSQQGNSADVTLRVDRDAYLPGAPIVVDARAPGASGEALVTLEGAFGVQATLARVDGGEARATLRAVDSPGALQVGVAFVRDGAVETSSMQIDVDGAGRAESATLAIAPSPVPGGEVALSLQGVRAGAGMVAVRLTSGDPSGSALFTSVPDMLSFDASTTQTSAPQSTTWHPWVDSTGEHPSILEFVRHTEPPPDLTIEEADTAAVSWSVERCDGSSLALQLPAQPGRYTLSVLDIADDGRVIVASYVVELP
jgi:hypothetical protein